MIDSMLVVAKEPLPGRVKTRLVPPLSHAEAAELAAAALADSLRAASRVPARQRVVVLDGAPGAWLPPDWACTAQSTGGLDVRLAAAFAHATGPALLIGMDTPQLRAEQLTVFDPDRYDACLGLAEDGGYWAIGFADPTHASSVINGVPMSTAHTGAAQLRRLRAKKLRVQLLDTVEDVDTFDAALRVASANPAGEFAQAVRGFAGAAA